MAKVRVKTGSEGPRHDPYSWSEIEFTKTDGTVVKYRYSALGYNRFEIDGERLPEIYDDELASDVFYALTGMPSWKAELMPNILEYRMMRRMAPRERLNYEQAIMFDRDMMRYAL